MKVFKFGGASVKSAQAIKNILEIIKLEKNNLFIVISAMDKTTNELENLLSLYFKKQMLQAQYGKIYMFHFKILNELFSSKSTIWIKINKLFEEIKKILKYPPDMQNYDKTYDSLIPYGELLSTTIISTFLNENGLQNNWLDARKILITDENFRQASVNFELSKEKIAQLNINENNIYITQGFIGSSQKNTTTLGREGSDYSAAVFANLLDAESLTLWKDVDGIYNADPKIIKNTIKLEKISFREATELAFFGAKIIHPKTAKPLMQKNIKLYIRSFNNPQNIGTVVSNFKQKIYPVTPIFIFNKNQTLITLSSRNLEFISENFLEKVFFIFDKNKTKINLIQNSALTISLCFDHSERIFSKLIAELENFFEIKYNNKLTLLTIRHYNNQVIDEAIKNKKIFMQQKNRLNAFFLYQEQ
jgi:aspartate kinase